MSSNYPQCFTVALVQLTSCDDVDKNKDRVFDSLRQIEQMGGARLVIFPENSLYFRLNQKVPIKAVSLEDPFFAQLTEYCHQFHCDVLLTTAIRETEVHGDTNKNEKWGANQQRSGGRPTNGTVWLRGDQAPELVYRKIHLFDVDVVGSPPIRESAEFRAGDMPKVINIDGRKIGLSICFDLRFSELFLSYAQQDVDMIVVPSAFLVPTGRAHWEVLLRARAIESQAYVMAPAQGGVHTNGAGNSRETWGHSLAIDPWGSVLGQIELANQASTGFQVLMANFDGGKVESVRRQIPIKSCRKLKMGY